MSPRTGADPAGAGRFDPWQQAVRTMADGLGYMVSESEGAVHIWNRLGCYQGRVRDWAAAYHLVAAVYVRIERRPPPGVRQAG